MKISIAASLLILAIGAAVGWHDRQQLAILRTTHERLTVEAANLGVFTGCQADHQARTSHSRHLRETHHGRSDPIGQ